MEKYEIIAEHYKSWPTETHDDIVKIVEDLYSTFSDMSAVIAAHVLYEIGRKK